MQSGFKLQFKFRTIEIPFNFRHFSDISENITRLLVVSSNHQYEVQSDVREEIFQAFLEYLVNDKLPDIDIHNIDEYIKLSLEFHILSDFIENKKNQFGEYLVILKGISNSNITDKSYYEQQIAVKLDDYLEKYSNDLLNLEFNILFNIFNHQKRNLLNHNGAYDFIVEHFNRNNDDTIFILLDSIDGTKLSKNNIEESFLKYNERLNHMPSLNFSYILNIQENQKKLEEKISMQQQEIEKLKDRLNEMDYQINGFCSLKDSDIIGKKFNLVHPFKINNKIYALCNKGGSNIGQNYSLCEWSKNDIKQKFTMLSNGVIKCVENEFVIDVRGGVFKCGTIVHTTSRNNSDAQLWTYDSFQKILKLKNKNFVLNIDGYKFTDNIIINIWTPNGHRSQIWELRLC